MQGGVVAKGRKERREPAQRVFNLVCSKKKQVREKLESDHRARALGKIRRIGFSPVRRQRPEMHVV